MVRTTLSRRTLGRRIDDYYRYEIKRIRLELQSVDYVCTTTDIWSGRRRSFIGVTAHWIAQDLRRKSAALSCKRFKGTHSYDHIFDLLTEINNDFGLDSSKIVATITDNGSNFVKAFQIFGVQLGNIEGFKSDDESTLDITDSQFGVDEDNPPFREFDIDAIIDKCKLLPAHLRCCAHTLSLCATTDANKILNKTSEQCAMESSM